MGPVKPKADANLDLPAKELEPRRLPLKLSTFGFWLFSESQVHEVYDIKDSRKFQTPPIRGNGFLYA